MSEQQPYGRVLAIVGSLAMATAVFAGLWVLGSPSHQRDVQLDVRRVSDLQQLTMRIQQYHHRKDALPLSLQEIDVAGVVAKDPVTRVPYTYSSKGDTFRLCATFSTEWDPSKDSDAPRYMALNSANWKHPAGTFCFDEPVTSSAY